MSKLAELLGRRKSKIDVSSYASEGNTQLRKRMSSILARPTRKDLNPPTLTPEDYAQAGFNEQPMQQAFTDEAAWRERTGDLATTAPASEADLPPETTLEDVATTGSDAQFEAWRPIEDSHSSDDPVADDCMAAQVEEEENETLERLRERLKNRLEALRHQSEKVPPPHAKYSEPQQTPDLIEDQSDMSSADHMAFSEDQVQPSEDADWNPASDRQAATGGPDSIDYMARLLGEIAAPSMAPDTEGLLVAHEAAASSPASGASEDDGTTAERVGEHLDRADEVTSTSKLDVPPVIALPLPASLAETGDEAQAADMAAKVTDYLMFEAGYYPEELPRTAVTIWCLDYLVRNLNENGLGAFVYNAWGQPEIWSACAEGLKACGAVRHLDAFEALSDLVVRNGALAGALAEDPGAGQDNPELVRIESDLNEAEIATPLAGMAGRWLLEQSEVDFVDDGRFQEAVSALGDIPALTSRHHEGT